MKEYRLLVDSTPESLSVKVQEYMIQGFELYGNPIMHCNGYGESAYYEYGQAVVRFAEKKKPVKAA